MPNRTWRQRLQQVADRDGRKLRAISLAAGLPPASLWEMLYTPKQPGIERLQAICGALNIPLSYIMEGIEVTPETDRLLKAWARLPKEQREALLDFLGRQKPR
jgi:transcriptional regulator with XRE-family HTH domain